MLKEQQQKILYPGASPLNEAPPPDPVAVHKKAFRVAYDTLRELWPTDGEMDWKWASERIALKYAENVKNPLLQELLLAIWGYLEEEDLERRKAAGRTHGPDGEDKTDERSNAADADVDGG